MANKAAAVAVAITFRIIECSPLRKLTYLLLPEVLLPEPVLPLAPPEAPVLLPEALGALLLPDAPEDDESPAAIDTLAMANSAAAVAVPTSFNIKQILLRSKRCS